MAEQLAAGNAAVALLGNTLATVFALLVLIEIFAPVSGAHMNPLVTWWSGMPMIERIAYTTAQLDSALMGAMLAIAMFERAQVEIAQQARCRLAQRIVVGVSNEGGMS